MNRPGHCRYQLGRSRFLVVVEIHKVQQRDEILIPKKHIPAKCNLLHTVYILSKSFNSKLVSEEEVRNTLNCGRPIKDIRILKLRGIISIQPGSFGP